MSTVKTLHADVAAFILTGLCIVAIAVLAGLQVEVPEVLVTVALVAVGASGGAALPRRAAAVDTPPAPPAPPAPAPRIVER